MNSDRLTDTLATGLVGSLLVLLIVQWTPVLPPETLFLLKAAISLALLLIIGIHLLIERTFVLPVRALSLFVFPYLLVAYHHGSGFYETRLLYLSLAGLGLIYFTNSSNYARQLAIGLHLMVLTTVVTSLFGLSCILTSIWCPTPSISYGPYIRQAGKVNLFGFSGELPIRLFVPIGIVLSGYFAYCVGNRGRRLLYIACGAILGVYMVTLIQVTNGHMRTSLFLLLTATAIIIGRQWSQFTRFLPHLVISPIVGYVILYVLAMNSLFVLPIVNELNLFMSKRIYLYFTAIEISIHHPLGVGFGNLNRYANPIPGISMMASVPNQAHNQFFIALTETGLPGAFGFTVTIGYVLTAARDVLRQDRLGMIQVLAIICVALLFTGLTVGEGGPIYAAFLGVVWWLSAAAVVTASRAHADGILSSDLGQGYDDEVIIQANKRE